MYVSLVFAVFMLPFADLLPPNVQKYGYVLESVEFVPAKGKTWNYQCMYNAAPNAASSAKLAASLAGVMDSLEEAKPATDITIKSVAPCGVRIAIGAQKKQSEPLVLKIQRIKYAKHVIYQVIFRKEPTMEQEEERLAVFLLEQAPTEYIMRHKAPGEWTIQVGWESEEEHKKVVRYTFKVKDE